MSDSISRQGVIDLLCRECGNGCTEWECKEVKSIKGMQSADRPTGKWIGEYEAQSKCSICGKNEDEFIDGWGEWETWRKSRYCPNCGARMENGDT